MRRKGRPTGGRVARRDLVASVNHPGNRTSPGVRLGLRENLGQFSLLILVNAFVGGMVGRDHRQHVGDLLGDRLRGSVDVCLWSRRGSHDAGTEEG